jgi:hypothetical protein
MIAVTDKAAPCVACEREPADCVAPIGDGAASMCWRCAHAIVENDATIATAAIASCSYPRGHLPRIERGRAERRQLS